MQDNTRIRALATTLVALALAMSAATQAQTAAAPAIPEELLEAVRAAGSSQQSAKSTSESLPLSAPSREYVPPVQAQGTREKRAADPLPEAALADALVIPFDALSAEDIAEARGEDTGASTLIIGVHRDLPAGYQGNLLDELSFTVQGEDRVGVIEVHAEGVTSVRVQLRASLPDGSSLTFSSLVEGALPAETWTAAYLEERSAATTPVWSPSGEGETLRVTVTVPSTVATADGHFLVFETISQRFASTLPDAPRGASHSTSMRPKHGFSGLDCPHLYEAAVCADPERREYVGSVVHLHYEIPGATAICSGTLLNGAPRRFQILTANHCISTSRAADSIETHHYYLHASCAANANIDPRYFRNSDGARLLTTLHSADQSLVELRARELRGRVLLAGWSGDPSNADPGFTAFGLHHPKGVLMAYASALVLGRKDVRVPEYGWVFNNIVVANWFGKTETGSSGSGLFADVPGLNYPPVVGALSSGPSVGCMQSANYGAFADFWRRAAPHLVPSGPPPGDVWKTVALVPWVLPANTRSQQSVLRFVNSSDAPARVRVWSKRDDRRRAVVACTFTVRALAAVHLSASDLTDGARSKGCRGVGGASVSSGLLIESDTPTLVVRSYGRDLGSNPGFLAPLDGGAEGVEHDGVWLYYLPLLNPGTDRTAQTRVRLTNTDRRKRVRAVYFWGHDSYGRGTGTTLRLARALLPLETVTLSALDLERGKRGVLAGAPFGSPRGQWAAFVIASGPVHVSAYIVGTTLSSNVSR